MIQPLLNDLAALKVGHGSGIETQVLEHLCGVLAGDRTEVPDLAGGIR